MRESVIYQEWRSGTLREGLEEGRKEALQQGLQLLRRKLGSLDPAPGQQDLGLANVATGGAGGSAAGFQQRGGFN